MMLMCMRQLNLFFILNSPDLLRMLHTEITRPRQEYFAGGGHFHTVAATDLTQEQRIARHTSFLAANWRLIAAFGWEHYQESGRGAVVADDQSIKLTNVECGDVTPSLPPPAP
jgi:hypothetical protein